MRDYTNQLIHDAAKSFAWFAVAVYFVGFIMGAATFWWVTR